MVLFWSVDFISVKVLNNPIIFSLLVLLRFIRRQLNLLQVIIILSILEKLEEKKDNFTASSLVYILVNFLKPLTVLRKMVILYDFTGIASSA